MIDRVIIGLEISFPAGPQGLGVESRTLTRVYRSPVGIDFDIVFQWATQPIEIERRISLFGKITTPLSLGALATAMAPHKAGVKTFRLGKRIVGGDSGLDPIEGSHRESDVSRDDFVRSPFFDHTNVQRLGCRIVIRPEGHRGLRYFIGIFIRNKTVLRLGERNWQHEYCEKKWH